MDDCRPPKEVFGLVEQDNETPESDEAGSEDERGHWSHKMDSLLSLIGYSVGFGNIWRFPYFCMRNGGGTFLFAFLCILVVCGLPTYFVDLVIGQFSGRTSLHAWEICPLLKGIGAGAVMILLVISYYYNILISWTLFYLGYSFVSPLPWRTCDNSWNTVYCISNRTSPTNASMGTGNATYISSQTDVFNATETNVTLTLGTGTGNESEISQKMVTSEEEFWQYRLLEVSPGIDEIGALPWHGAVCFFVAWVLIFLTLIRGIKSAGKVVYVTAVLPYVILTILLIRAVLLPGAVDGIRYYITPDLYKLGELQVWLEAALQVFYSLGPGWGPLVTLASYNKFDNNCYRDSIIMAFISEGTSIFGGFVVFAVLGFMAHESGIHISEVVTSGPGLVFMAYPEALAQLPLPNVWTVLFFLMLLTVGLDSQITPVETVVSAILDQFPFLRRKRLIILIVSCVLWYLLGLILCTQGGMYVFIVIDWYVALFVPLIALLECIIIGWIYGAERFSRDVNLMIGRGIPVLMRIAITFIAPFILLVITVFTIATYKTPSYGDYQFPAYITPIGFCLGILPVLPIIVQGFIAVKNASGDTILQRVVNSSKPSLKWKPASRKHAMGYEYDELSEYNTFCSRLRLNILGPR